MIVSNSENDVTENNGSVVSNITGDDSVEADNALSLNDKKGKSKMFIAVDNGKMKMNMKLIR